MAQDPFAERRRTLQRQALSGPPDDRNIVSRSISDAGQLLGSIPRAFAEMVGAPVSDLYSLLPGGTEARAPTATGNLIKELGLSMGRTAVGVASGQSILSAAWNPSSLTQGGRARSLEDFQRLTDSIGWERGGEIAEERAAFRHSNPVTSLVEDIGNISIGGAVVGKAAGGAAIRGAGRTAEVAPLSTRARPLEGRDARVERRAIIDDIAGGGDRAPRVPEDPFGSAGGRATPAAPGQRAAHLSQVASDVAGHPYRASMRATSRVRTPGGGTLGDAARSRGAPILDEFYARFPQFRPEAREARALHQELVREEVRDARLGALDRFDPVHAVPDAQESIRAMSRFEPETLEQLGAVLPDRTLIDKIKGTDPLTPEATREILLGVQELHKQGRTDVMPKWADTDGQLRLSLAILSLDEAATGLPTDALVDLIPWMERLDAGLPALRNQQRALREAGFDNDMLRDLYGGSERFILDEKLLDPALDTVLAGEDTVRVYRGMGEELDLERVGDEGIRFTRDVDYALDNTNETPNTYLYELEVPRDRLLESSEIAQAQGAEPYLPHAVLTADDAARARRIDPSEARRRTAETPLSAQVHEHLQAARSAYRRWNDVDEQALLRNQRIPEEGTRYRYVRDEDGQVITDPETGEARIERVAEVDERVPFESQGGSKAQNAMLRRRRTALGKAERAMEKTRENLESRQIEARAEVADLERTLARDIENLSKRAVAAGDDPNAARLWDEWYELTKQYDELQAGGGLRLPARLSDSLEGVNTALDEVIALASSPALRDMLEPKTYTRIKNAVDELRTADEFLDNSGERLTFFDTLDAIDQRRFRQDGGVARAEQQGAREARAARGEGPGMERAQQDVLRARERLSMAEDAATPLFDADAAAARLERAVASYKRARAPYRETLLKRQTRARETLRRAKYQEQRLGTLERKFTELQDEIAASIESAPAPARDLLWLGEISARIADDMDTLVSEGVVDASIRDALDIRGLPKTLEDVTGAADAQLARELTDPNSALRQELDAAGGEGGFDINYVPDFAATPEGAPSAPSTMGPVVRTAQTTRRRGGGNAPLEQSFRQILVKRTTDLRVEQFKQTFADEVNTRFGRTPEDILREVVGDEATLKGWLEQPGKAERELVAAGYVAFKPGDLFEFRQRRTGLGGADEPMWIKRELADTIKGLASSGTWETFVREIWNPATTGWKRAVLALRPAWHVYNAVGGAVLATFAGRLSVADMMDFIPVATEAWRRNQHGYQLSTGSLDNLPLGRWGEGAGRRLQAQGIRLDDLPADADRTVFSQGISRRELQLDYRQTGLAAMIDRVPGVEQARGTRAGGHAERVMGQLNRVTTRSYRTNAMIDDIYRSTVYLARTMRHGDDIGSALVRVSESMGNYQKMTPFEKNYVRAAYPFYAWLRHITGVTVRGLRPDNITRTMILAQAVNILGEPNEYEEMLPGWAGGDIHVGFDDEGVPRFLATRGLNPFADVLAPLEVGGHFNPAGALAGAHPLIQIGVEQGTGINTLTGRPFSTPTPRRDEDGNALPTPPPLGEQLFNTIPQLGLARDIGRSVTGEPTTRYGTGEALLLPGVENAPLAGRIGQMFGANIRPLNVEQMNAQRIKNRYEAMRQSLRYEARLEAQQEQQGLPLLPSALGGRP